MFTEKLKTMVRKQAELVAKGSEISDAEKIELDKLNAAILAATQEPRVEKSETRLTTMTAEEFTKYVQDNTGENATSDLAVLGLVKRNIEAVRAQKAEGKDVFAVELPIEKTEDDKMAELLGRIASLEAKLASKNAENEGEGKGEGEGESEDDVNKGLAEDLAMEAMDALLTKFATLKEKMNKGNVTQEDINEAFSSNWQLRDLIEMAAALMAKTNELNELVQPVLTALEDLEKQPSKNDDEDDSDEDDSDDEEGDINKGEDVSWSGDLAKGLASQDDNEEFKRLKNAGGRSRE